MLAFTERGSIMSGNKDRAKGRVKQALGALTGDEKLKNEGRRDERTGQIKLKVEKAVETVREKVEDLVKKTAAPLKKEK